VEAAIFCSRAKDLRVWKTGQVELKGTKMKNIADGWKRSKFSGLFGRSGLRAGKTSRLILLTLSLLILLFWFNFLWIQRIPCSYGEPAPFSEVEERRQIVLYPEKDSFIQHDYPYYDPTHHPSCYNYGGSPNLITASGSQSNHPRILVQFDLSSIPAEAVIASAQLKLYCRSAVIWKDIACYPLTHAWVEGTMTQTSDPPQQTANGVTWKTFDGTSNWTIPGGDYASYQLLDKVWIASDSDTGWKSWNVTSTVQGWASGILPNNGFILATLAAGNYYASRFCSKEHSDSSLWPRLEINYEMPEPPEEPLIRDVAVSPEAFDPYDQAGQVEISYELREDSLAKIEIFDADGEKVKALFEDLEEGKEVEIEKEQEAGHHTESWCGVIDFEETAILDGDKGVLLAPDGDYVVRVTARSKAIGEVENAEVSVELDSE